MNREDGKWGWGGGGEGENNRAHNRLLAMCVAQCSIYPEM